MSKIEENPGSRPALISYPNPTSQTGTPPASEITPSKAKQPVVPPTPSDPSPNLMRVVNRQTEREAALRAKMLQELGDWEPFTRASPVKRALFLDAQVAQKIDEPRRKAVEQLARARRKMAQGQSAPPEDFQDEPGNVLFNRDSTHIGWFVDPETADAIKGKPASEVMNMLFKLLLTPIPSSVEYHSVERLRGIVTIVKGLYAPSDEQARMLKHWERQLKNHQGLKEICDRLNTTAPELAWKFFSISEGTENPTLETLIEFGTDLLSQLSNAAQEKLLREEVRFQSQPHPHKTKQKNTNRQTLPYHPRDRGPGSREIGGSSPAILTRPVAVHPSIPLDDDDPDTERRMREGGFRFVAPATPKDRSTRVFSIDTNVLTPLAPRVSRWNPLAYESREALLAAIRGFPDGNNRYSKMNESQLLLQMRRHHLPGIEILLKQDWFQKLYLSRSDGETSFLLIEHTYPDTAGNRPKNPVKEVVSIGQTKHVHHLFVHPKDSIPPLNAPIFKLLPEQQSSQEPASRTRVVSGETTTFSFEGLSGFEKKLPAIRVSFRDPFLGPTSYLVIPK